MCAGWLNGHSERMGSHKLMVNGIFCLMERCLKKCFVNSLTAVREIQIIIRMKPVNVETYNKFFNEVIEVIRDPQLPASRPEQAVPSFLGHFLF